jgi:hypothetical protein
MADGTRTGLILLGCSLLLAGLSALCYWASYSEGWNFGPLLFAMVGSIGTCVLIGFGIKKLASGT